MAIQIYGRLVSGSPEIDQYIAEESVLDIRKYGPDISNIYQMLNKSDDSVSDQVIDITIKALDKEAIKKAKKEIITSLDNHYVDNTMYSDGYISVNFHNYDKSGEFSIQGVDGEFETSDGPDGYEWGYYTINDDAKKYHGGKNYTYSESHVCAKPIVKYPKQHNWDLDYNVDEVIGEGYLDSVASAYSDYDMMLIGENGYYKYVESTPNAKRNIYPKQIFNGETVYHIHIPNHITYLPANWLSIFGKPINPNDFDIRIVGLTNVTCDVTNLLSAHYYTVPQTVRCVNECTLYQDVDSVTPEGVNIELIPAVADDIQILEDLSFLIKWDLRDIYGTPLNISLYTCGKDLKEDTVFYTDALSAFKQNSESASTYKCIVNKNVGLNRIPQYFNYSINSSEDLCNYSTPNVNTIYTLKVSPYNTETTSISNSKDRLVYGSWLNDRDYKKDYFEINMSAPWKFSFDSDLLVYNKYGKLVNIKEFNDTSMSIFINGHYTEVPEADSINNSWVSNNESVLNENSSDFGCICRNGSCQNYYFPAGTHRIWIKFTSEFKDTEFKASDLLLKFGNLTVTARGVNFTGSSPAEIEREKQDLDVVGIVPDQNTFWWGPVNLWLPKTYNSYEEAEADLVNINPNSSAWYNAYLCLSDEDVTNYLYTVQYATNGQSYGLVTWPDHYSELSTADYFKIGCVGNQWKIYITKQPILNMKVLEAGKRLFDSSITINDVINYFGGIRYINDGYNTGNIYYGSQYKAVSYDTLQSILNHKAGLYGTDEWKKITSSESYAKDNPEFSKAVLGTNLDNMVKNYISYLKSNGRIATRTLNDSDFRQTSHGTRAGILWSGIDLKNPDVTNKFLTGCKENQYDIWIDGSFDDLINATFYIHSDILIWDYYRVDATSTPDYYICNNISDNADIDSTYYGTLDVGTIIYNRKRPDLLMSVVRNLPEATLYFDKVSSDNSLMEKYWKPISEERLNESNNSDSKLITLTGLSSVKIDKNWIKTTNLYL